MRLTQLLYAALLVTFSSHVAQGQTSSDNTAPGRYIVYIERSAEKAGGSGVGGPAIPRQKEETVDDFIESQPEITKVHDLASIGAKAVQIDNESALAALSSLPGVAKIEKDVPRYSAGFAQFSSPLSSSLPHLRASSLRKLQVSWTYGTKMIGADVTPFNAAAAPPSTLKVCVMDSGVLNNHPGLEGVPQTGGPEGFVDECGHGTHVTGTVASRGKGFGVADGVGVHSVRVLGPVQPDGRCYWSYASDVIAAAEQCKTGAASSKMIINMSLGGPSYSTAEEEAFRRLFNEGVLSVASAMNGGNTDLSYPASYEHVISVGALDSTKTLAYFSQRNAQVDIAGPGVDVYSTYLNNQFTYMSGTSMAAPHVAGAAATVWSYNLGWSNAQVRDALYNTAEDLGPKGRDDGYGHGLVNVCKAAKLAGFDPTNAVTCPGEGSPPGDCTPLEENTDYLDNDIGNVWAAAATDCCGVCAATSGCKAFSWSDYNGGTCWLKSAKGATAIKFGVRSAALSSPSPTCSPIEENLDYVDHDIGNVKRSRAEDCCDACQSTAGCGAYSWSNFEGGTCWLKSQKGSTVWAAGVRSAILYACSPIEEDVDYVDNDMGNAKRANAEDCCSVCRSTAGCGAFSWSNFEGGTCWLKSGKGNTIRAPGVRSASVLK